MQVRDRQQLTQVRHSRRTFGLLVLSICSSGCSGPWIKREEKENELVKRTKEVKEYMQSENRPKLIGDAANITGLAPQQFEAFGIVHKLPGTGGDTRPGASRDYVLRELRIREVEQPNAVIASDSTAIVKVRAISPAGTIVGDRIDVIVEKSIDCDATDLRNGELMATRLLDLVPIDGKVRQSNLKAIAAGQLVTVPPSLNSTKDFDRELAIVLGGARVMDELKVYIRMSDNVRHVMSTKAAADAINARFDVYDKGERKGIATAKSDRSIELQIPAKYRADVVHFSETVMSVAFMEKSEEKKKERIEDCRKRMKDYTKVRLASKELEAIGKESIPVLKETLQNPDKEIQFYSAHSLAYLDDPASIPVLVTLIRTEPAFRANGLIALTIIDHPEADLALKSLLQDPEPEVCFSALRALRKRRSFDPIAGGQVLDGFGRITEIASPHPMVAVSLSSEPEIAVFGSPIPIQFNSFYEVSPRMTMKNDNGLIRLAHFRPGEEDLVSIAEPNLRSLLQAFFDVKATYSDAIIFLDKAGQEGWIKAPVKFNPVASTARKYDRSAASEQTGAPTKDGDKSVSVKRELGWWDPRRLWAE